MTLGCGIEILVLLLTVALSARAEPKWKDPWISITADMYVTHLDQSSSTIQVFEDVPVGHTIVTLHVDAKQGDTVDVACDKGQMAFNSTGRFPDFAASLVSPLDYETSQQIFITISLNGGYSQTMLLSVLDVNDNVPVFTGIGSQVNLDVPENHVNLSLLKLAATDADRDATPLVTYSLLTEDPKLFRLQNMADPQQPQCMLQVVHELDFETSRLYKLSVQATDTADARGLVQSASVTVFITVKDVGDSPPRWLREPPTKNIDESDAKKGTLLYTVKAIDGDTEVNNTIVYSVLKQSLDGTVTIDENSGGVTLQTNLDREDPRVDDLQGFITVTIQAQEKGQKCSNITCVHSDSLIQVNDVDDNAPKFDKPRYSVEVSEGTSNQLNLNINVTDPDSHYPNGAFELTLKDAPEGVFAITSPKGVRSLIADISVADPDYLDFEQRREIAFQVVVTGDNPGKRSATAAVTVTLTDINDNDPAFEHPSYQVTITEDYAKGRDVTIVNATDADISEKFGSDSIRYTLSGGKESAIVIDARTGNITVANQETPPFDYDAGDRVFNYTVHARDDGGTGNAATAQLIVTIKDVDDRPPTLHSLPVLNVTENANSTEITSNISASDVDTAAQLKFSIDWAASSGTKDGKPVPTTDFQPCLAITTVSAESGTVKAQLTTTDTALDREKVDTVELAIVVTDTQTAVGEDSARGTATIQVLDVNDNDPQFTNINASSHLSVTENWPTEVRITTIMAEDPDQDSDLTYTLSGDANYTSLVRLEKRTGQLTVARNIDRETYSQLTLTFTATDSGTPPRNTSLTLDVEVKDLNDCPPEWVTDPNDLVVSVLEGPATGIVITTIQATDKDKPNTPASAITYRLTGDGRRNLTIDPSTGDVRVKGLLDREMLADTSYTLTVRVEAGDQCTGDNCVHTVGSYLHVQVNDINDMPPVLPPPGDTPLVDIDETKPAGSDVGSVRGTDADAANTPAATLTFALATVTARRSGCERTDLFSVATDQNTARLSTNGSLHGCWGDYNVTLTATDGEPPFHNTSQVYSAHVSDVNDQPSFAWPQNGFAFSIKENIYDGSRMPVLLPNGTQMAFVAQDPDDPQLPNSRVTYSLLPSSTPGIATTTFAVDPNSGVLYLTSQVDRESKDGHEFTLKVEARDQGAGGGLAVTRSVMVTISDIDEFVPVFSDRQNHDTRFTEEQPVGAAIFTVTSVATDADDTKHIFYFVVGGAKDMFQLVSSSGPPNLRTRQKLDRETKDQYQLILQTTSTNDYPGDAGHFDPANLHQLNMTIFVQDIDDNPPALPHDLMAGVAAEDQKNVPIVNITATDPDLNETITYSVTGNFTTEDPSLQDILDSTIPFQLNAATGELMLNFDVDSNMKGWIDFKVTATDKVRHSDTQPVRVFIITKADRVRFVFGNPVAMVTANQKLIADILSNVFKYKANIERIAESTEFKSSTEVRTHFIDLSKPSKPVPVESNTIVNMQFEGDTSNQLIDGFHAIALDLTHIDDGSVKKPAEKNTVFQMLLIVVGSVLGGLLAITLITSCIQIKKLRRQVRALSINAFGSRESGLQKAGLTVPGSNMYAHQETNPVFSMDEGAKSPDAESQSSGDSVLIGVEDDPEFRGYKRPAPQLPSAPPTDGDDDVTPAVFDETMRMPRFEVDVDDGFAEDSIQNAMFAGESGVSQNPLFGANLDDVQ